MKPIFIFSLPKSGSTLLQRILGASPYISTASEPWILLPYIYTLKSNGIVSEYWHKSTFEAIEDFLNKLPNGQKDYFIELEKFILNLYRKSSHADSIYFLDKTPRYSIICNEIINLFPDGKFIFLWRNPLAIVSSIIQRWYNGKWKIYVNNIDLYEGIENLSNTYNSNKSNVHAVNYENLIQDPELEVRKICDYLNMDYDDQMLNNFYNTPLVGRMTEHTGSEIYKAIISKDSLNNWKNTFNNPYRRHWAKKYLEWIGNDRLKLMGYDFSKVKSDLLKDYGVSKNSLFLDLFYTFFVKYRIILSPIRTTNKQKIKHLFK